MTHKGYKGFGKNLTCRGFAYKEGETATMEGEISACDRGFHYCENPFDVLNYYPLLDDNAEMTEFAEVKSMVEPIKKEDKCVTSSLKIEAKLSFKAFIGACINFVLEKNQDRSGGNA